MFILHGQVRRVDMGGGILRQDFAEGEQMNVLHWNMAPGSKVALHCHSQEQFGYVIQGSFEVVIGDETRVLCAGDAYTVPPNVLHSFVALEQTEAIDVFSPVKRDFPWLPS